MERTLRCKALQAAGRSEMEALILQEFIGTEQAKWHEIMNIMTERRHNHESVAACHAACAEYSPDRYGDFASIVLDHCIHEHASRSFDSFCQLSIVAIFKTGCTLQDKYGINIENHFIHKLCMFIADTFLQTERRVAWYQAGAQEALDFEVKRYFRPSNPGIRKELFATVLESLPTLEASLKRRLEILRVRGDYFWTMDNDSAGPGAILFRCMMIALMNPEHSDPIDLISMAQAKLKNH